MKIEETAVYTYKDLEMILGVKERTLYPYVEAGNLLPIRFGNKLRFLGEDVLVFLRGMRQKQ